MQDVDAGRLLLAARAVERNVRDLCVVVELHAEALEVLDHGQDHRLVLVVAGEAQRRKVGQTADVMDVALQIALHLQCAVPVLKSEHRAPVHPEVGVQHLIVKEVGDLLVVQALVGGHKETHNLHGGLVGQAEFAVGVGVLAAVVGGAAEAVVGVGLVQPVVLIQNGVVLVLDGRDGAEQIPHTLKVVVHLAPAAHDVAEVLVVVAVAGTARDGVFLENVDVLALHLGIANEIARRRQRRQAGADDVGRFAVHIGGLLGGGKGFIVTGGIIHKSTSCDDLIRMYGPIPIMDQNIPVNAGEEEVKVFRNTIDECFDYVINTLTEIIDSNHLPDKIMNEAEELGRITQGIAMAIRAEVMVTAASPLFNGNADYKGYTDSRGIEIFNPNKSEQDKKQRWIDAAEACKQAIEFLKAQGHDLYKYTSLEYTISDQTRAKMNIRNIVTEKWNQEIIWANSNSIIGQLQDHAIPRGLEPGKEGNASVGGNLAVPLKIADLFYTKNGVPITEDKTWNYDDRFELRKATANDKYFIKEGYTTANLNFDREVRYYASLGFDGAVWFGQGVTDETKPIYVQCKQGQSAANQIANSWNETGIWPKKLVHFKSVVGQTSGFTKITYPFPVMRLGNLYLLYAEALNESGATKTDVLTWVDLIRERAGLKGVEESWDTYTNNKKYETIDGRREIIQQERGIELAFEAQRFWDLRRWKLAFQEQNKPITGWNTQYSTNEDYYTEQLIYTQEFRIRNYFWPILDKELYSNKNLVQNYGW